MHNLVTNRFLELLNCLDSLVNVTGDSYFDCYQPYVGTFMMVVCEGFEVAILVGFD